MRESGRGPRDNVGEELPIVFARAWRESLSKPASDKVQSARGHKAAREGGSLCCAEVWPCARESSLREIVAIAEGNGEGLVIVSAMGLARISRLCAWKCLSPTCDKMHSARGQKVAREGVA